MLVVNSVKARLKQLSRQDLIAIGLLLAVAVGLFFVILIQNPQGVDWNITYRPAALAMASGKNPFTEVELFFTSPWALIPVIPFALLPPDIGRSLWAVVSIGMLAFVCHKLGGKPIALLAFLLSAPVANSIQTGNIEGLVLLGFILPPQIGLVFLAMKPQSTFIAIIYFMVEAWRNGGIKEAFRVTWPTALIGVLSLVVYGLWPLKVQEIFNPAGVFNISLWPAGIPIGLVLAVKALRDRKQDLSMMASPFLSPYVILLSWSGPLAAFSASTLEMVVLSIGSWIFWAIFYPSVIH